MGPEKKPKKPVDIYIRVSQVRGRQGDSFQSPTQQEKRCRAQLKADGLKAGKVFTDLDQSGAKASRPAFDQALARIAAGESGGVVVHDLSRFGRNTRNVLDGIDFIESHGAVFVSCAEKLDTATATGRFVMTLFAALREMEREQSKERWQVAKAGAKARGVHIGVARAGYKRNRNGELVEVPKHMEAVRAAFALRSRGASWQEVANSLTGAVPTWHGRKVWTRQAAQALISNHAYRGTIPAWQWDKAQPKKNGKRSPRGEGYVLGQGLVRCKHCGMGLVKTVSHGASMLRCGSSGTGHAAISYDKAADYIVSVAFSHLGPMLKSRAGGDGAALRQAVESAREEYNAAVEMLGVEMLPPESRQAHALEQAEAAQAEFEAQADAPLGLADLLTPVGAREEFEKLSVSEQRRVLRQIIERVVLAPGRGHVGERVVVEFVDGSRWPGEWSEAQVPALAR
jgi:site-specific DNA recombinase